MKTTITLIFAMVTQLLIAQSVIVKDANGKWGLKDPNGTRMLVPGRYETEAELLAQDFIPGIAGYYNKSGKLVMQGDWIPELKGSWKGEGDFVEDRAVVTCKGKYSFIDKKGRPITGFTFSYAQDFRDGKARVTDYNTRESYFIDKKGKRIYEKTSGANIKSFIIYIGNGLYKGKKVNYEGETKYKYGSAGWGVNNKYAEGKGIGEIEGVGTYNGQWVNNIPHGKGTIQLKNGESFTGEFVNGTPQGSGTHYSNKGIQAGSFVKGEKVEADVMYNGQPGNNYLTLPGASSATYQNGKYEGQLLNGMQSGKGKFTYNNGAVYEGQWKDGLPEGNGKMVLKNGTTYDGTFVRGYFTKGKIFKYLRDVKENEVIPYGNNLVAYAKGWKKVIKTKEVLGGILSDTISERELSTGTTASPDWFVEVLGEFDKQLWYGGFVEKKELASTGKTVESTSTYGYHDSKKSANVIVNTTTKSDIPATYKTVRVPCEGCDENGYKTRLLLDRSKFNDNYNILPHELVNNDNLGSTASTTAANNATDTGTNPNTSNTIEETTVTPVALPGTAKKLKFKLDNHNKVDYTGEVKDGKANGYGEAKIFLMKDIYWTYKGFWKDNLQNGKGVLYMGQRDKYEGDFLNGKWHGKGTFVSVDKITNGYTYVGDFQNSSINGYGKKTYTDGRIEVGYFEKGIYKGKQP